MFHSSIIFGALVDDCHGSLAYKIMVIIVNVILGGIILGGLIGIIISLFRMRKAKARYDAAKIVKGKRRIINILIGMASFLLMYVTLNIFIPGGVTLRVFLEPENACRDTSGSSGSSNLNQPQNPEVAVVGASYPSGYTPISNQGGTITGTGDATGYMVVDTKQSVVTYQSILAAHHVAEDKLLYGWNNLIRKLYGGDSETQLDRSDKSAHSFGHDLLTDSLTSDDCIIHRVVGAWSPIRDSDKKKILAVVYNQLSNGRPVVLEVCKPNDNCKSRHFVTIVGYKNSVKSAVGIKQEDLLVLGTSGSFTNMSADDSSTGFGMRLNNKQYRVDIPGDGLIKSGKVDMLDCKQ